MRDEMASYGKLPAELSLKGMTGEIVNQETHSNSAASLCSEVCRSAKSAKRVNKQALVFAISKRFTKHRRAFSRMDSFLVRGNRLHFSRSLQMPLTSSFSAKPASSSTISRQMFTLIVISTGTIQARASATDN